MDFSRIEKNDVAMGMCESLWAKTEPMTGYDLIMAQEDVLYAHGKSTLQMLRAEAVLNVVKDGPSNKKKWVAYQTFWFSPHAEKWMEGRDEASHAHFEQFMTEMRTLVIKLGVGRKRISESWLDDPRKVLVLKHAMSRGFVDLQAVATGDGKAFAAEVKVSL